VTKNKWGGPKLIKLAPSNTEVRVSSAKTKGVSPQAMTDQFRWCAAVAIAGLILAALISLAGHTKPNFTPGSDFSRFAAFYVVAQSIERFVEIFAHLVPPYGDDAATKADRALVLGAVTLLAGVIVARFSGLLFLETIGWHSPPSAIDVFVTALVITGGSKALHDVISNIQS
jgi:hypothetical protein